MQTNTRTPHDDHRSFEPALTRFAPLFCLLGASLGLTQPTLCFAQTTVATYTVNTLVGSAQFGDGGRAAGAVPHWPRTIVFDKAGKISTASVHSFSTGPSRVAVFAKKEKEGKTL